MATYRKTDAGRWRCDVKRDGIRRSKTFKSKNDAMLWGIEQEKLIGGADGDYIPGYSVSDCFDRYAREVSPKKAGERWEVIRLKKLSRDPMLGPLPAHSFGRRDIDTWIAGRLESVSPATVNRELNLILAVLRKAIDWKWATQTIKRIDRPGKTPPRRRRITDTEINKICSILDIDQNQIEVYKRIHELGVIFLFAIETACRLGEICGLQWKDVYLDKRYIHLPATKNGDSRDVPLSNRAVELLRSVKGDRARVFSLANSTASTLFTRYRKKAKIENLHFHDTRHEAVSRLAKKLDMLQLAKVVGHRDPRSLMIYYEPTIEELASQLD